jgi:RNB domain
VSESISESVIDEGVRWCLRHNPLRCLCSAVQRYAMQFLPPYPTSISFAAVPLLTFFHRHLMTLIFLSVLQAERRMVSVYMPDERISMFPYALSTELLSLGAGVDSYALSCGVTLDAHGTYVINKNVHTAHEKYTRRILQCVHPPCLPLLHSLHLV